MRWGVNWQLVTGERKKKSLWSSPPSPLLPPSTLLTLPQLAPIYSLSRALFLKRESHSLFWGGGFVWGSLVRRTGLQNLRVRFCQQARRAGGGPDGPQVPLLQVSPGQSLLDPAHNGSDYLSLSARPHRWGGTTEVAQTPHRWKHMTGFTFTCFGAFLNYIFTFSQIKYLSTSSTTYRRTEPIHTFCDISDILYIM